MEINPAVERAMRMGSGDTLLIESNAKIVRRDYSLNRIGKQLINLYQRLAASPRDRALHTLKHGSRILESFLELSRFHMLRVES